MSTSDGRRTTEPTEAVPVALADWERKFGQNPDDWFFGREPSEMARLTLNYWRLLHRDQRGSVLDHGAGEGRDSVFFSEKGFQITAVEGTEAGVQKIRRLAAEKGVQIASIVQSEVRQFSPPHPFDIVLSHNCLQFLGEEALAELARLKSMVTPGGVISVAAFTKEAEALAGRNELYRFDRNELKFQFRDWRLLYYGEYFLWREPSQNYFSFASIIAQKPM